MLHTFDDVMLVKLGFYSCHDKKQILNENQGKTENQGGGVRSDSKLYSAQQMHTSHW